MKKIAWITDPHLNFLSWDELREQCSDLKDLEPDVLLIGGDIAEAPTLEEELRRFDTLPFPHISF